MHRICTLVILIFLHFSTEIAAQFGKVSTLAGTDKPLDGPGNQALFLGTWQVHVRDSLAFISDYDDNALRKINLINKKVSTVLTGQKGISGFAFTRSGDTVYFATNNHILKRYILSTQNLKILDTLPDGGISAMVCRRNGALIIGSDEGHRVAEWTGPGQLRNLAGKLNTSGLADGPDSLARFNRISSIVLSLTEDTMYISDRFNSRIRRYIRSSRQVGSLNTGNVLFGPEQITFSRRRDSLYVANASLHSIAAVPLRGGVNQIICSVSGSAGFADGTALQSRFNYPVGIARSDSGLVICDYYNQRIRLFKNGFIRSIAGIGLIGNGTGQASRFNTPYDLAKHPLKDSLYVTDQNNHAIRLINLRNMKVSTLVGNGLSGNVSGNDPAAIRLNRPTNLAMSPSGDTLFFVEPFAQKIKYLLTRSNQVRWLAGSDTVGYKDHPNGKFARFNRPSDLAYKNGNLYVADALNHRIRKISVATSSVTTFAGSVSGFRDSTLAGARFNRPVTLEWADEELWVGEDAGLKIRRINPAEDTVIRWAGSGNIGQVDGPGNIARFKGILKITYDPFQKGFLVAGYLNEGVCRFVSRDTSLVRTFFDSTGYQDGPLGSASFLGPMGFWADPVNERMLFSDAGNNRIRSIQYLINRPPSCVFDTASVNGLFEDQSLISLPGVLSLLSPGTGPIDSAQSISIQIESVPAGKIINASADASGTLSFQPAPDSNGVFLLKVRLKDNGGTALGGTDSSIYFKAVRVKPVNDAPQFLVAGNDTASFSSARKRPGFVLKKTTGPSDENWQTLETEILCSNPQWFSQLPYFSGDTLMYNPAGDSLGTTQVIVRLRDNGGIEDGGTDSTVSAFSIVLFDLVSARPLVLRPALRIYPNPTQSVFRVANLPATCSRLELYDPAGRHAAELFAGPDGFFRVPENCSGLYIVRDCAGTSGLISIRRN